MLEITKLAEEIAFSAQPTFLDLRRLRKLGYRTLVNARLPAEQPAREGPDVRRAGMHYIRIPVAQPNWSEAVFDELEATLRDPDALPAIVHCDTGGRSGVLALTWFAARHGWSLFQLEAAARGLGLALPDAARRWYARHAQLEAPL